MKPPHLSEESDDVVHIGETMGTEMVTIYAGPQRKLFRVHKDLICSAGEFFEKTFNGAFKEGVEKSMDLPDTAPEIFSLFVAYCYQGQVPHVTGQVVENEAAEKQRQNLGDLYIFAESHCLNTTFLNVIMDRVQDAHYWSSHARSLEPSTFLDWYDNTKPDSKLRKFLVMFALSMLKNECRDRLDRALPPDVENFHEILFQSEDFRRDFVATIMEDGMMILGSLDRNAIHRSGSGTRDIFFLDPVNPQGQAYSVMPCCYFHIHDDKNEGKDCYLVKRRTREDLDGYRRDSE